MKEILKKGGDGHRANTAGDRRNCGNDIFDVFKIDIADKLSGFVTASPEFIRRKALLIEGRGSLFKIASPAVPDHNDIFHDIDSYVYYNLAFCDVFFAD